MKILTQEELEQRIFILIRKHSNTKLELQEAKVGIYLGTQYQENTVNEYIQYLSEDIVQQWLRGLTK